MNEKYTDVTKAVKPTVVKATCAGSEMFLAAWCKGDVVALRRDGNTYPVSLLIAKVPMAPEGDVKCYARWRVEDIDAFAKTGITLFSDVTVSGVATKVTETSTNGVLKYKTYDLKVAKVQVDPCDDPAIKEFDEPLPKVTRAEDTRKRGSIEVTE